MRFLRAAGVLLLWFAAPAVFVGYFGILIADGLCRTRPGWPESTDCIREDMRRELNRAMQHMPPSAFRPKSPEDSR